MDNIVKTGEISDYYQQADNWDATQRKQNEAVMKRNNLYRNIGLGIGAAATLMYVLFPLTQTVPYVIRVDQKLGGVDVVEVMDDTQQITSDEAVTRYFLSEYIRNRETWIFDGREGFFNKAAAHSNKQVRDDLVDLRKESNPQSPYNLYGSQTTVNIRIRNISFLDDRVAQVRFSKDIQKGVTKRTQDYISTVNFIYLEKPATERARLANPLGFIVTSYASDVEIQQ